MSAARVLVIDDDAAVRYTLRGFLEEMGLGVVEAADGESGLAQLAAGGFALVLLDLRMPGVDGLEVLRRLGERRPAERAAPRVIMLTAHGSERHAVEAMKLGAFDYFKKPFEPDELIAVIARALELVRLEVANEALASELALARTMVFCSEPMRRLASLVQRVAPRDVTVLVTGESGTGKELLARAIVRASKRADRPLVRFNCASLAPDLVESELFGHVRGAFTGAQAARPGLFREADGGTLFLDEVGELGPRAQAALLRALQEGEVRPVGADRTHEVDVRILAATHRDLARLVAEGRFREDLYYRLKVVELKIPPLRERPDDIALLARTFIDRCVDAFGLSVTPLVPAGFFERLRALPWPGNVRELENAIESLVAMSPEGTLDVSLLPSSAAGADADGDRDEGRGTLRARLDAYERGLIVSALAEAGNNRSEAARALGIGRATLHEKLKKLGINDLV